MLVSPAEYVLLSSYQCHTCSCWLSQLELIWRGGTSFYCDQCGAEKWSLGLFCWLSSKCHFSVGVILSICSQMLFYRFIAGLASSYVMPVSVVICHPPHLFFLRCQLFSYPVCCRNVQAYIMIVASSCYNHSFCDRSKDSTNKDNSNLFPWQEIVHRYYCIIKITVRSIFYQSIVYFYNLKNKVVLLCHGVM